MSNINDMTTIIAADYMYLIMLGNDNIIKKIVDKLNKKSKENKLNTQYTMCRIDKPCAELLDEKHIQDILINDAKNIISNNQSKNDMIEYDIDRYKKYIVFNEGVETAQCLTYADILSTENITFVPPYESYRYSKFLVEKSKTDKTVSIQESFEKYFATQVKSFQRFYKGIVWLLTSDTLPSEDNSW